MRRFSQRSHLVTLSEINITPLLDLAFVLLIIFVITTPLLEQSINLKLPGGVGKPDKQLNKSDIRTVEITTGGLFKLQKIQMPMPQIVTSLASEFRQNPNLIVYIRADKACRYDYVAQILDGCEKHGITRYSLRTDPTPK